MTLERRGEEQYRYYSSSTRQLCKSSPKGIERISPVGKKWWTGTWNLSSHSRFSNRAIREPSTVCNTGMPRKSRDTRQSLPHFMVNECHLLNCTREAKTEARNRILKEPSVPLFSHVPTCTSLYLGLLHSLKIPDYECLKQCSSLQNWTVDGNKVQSRRQLLAIPGYGGESKTDIRGLPAGYGSMERVLKSVVHWRSARSHCHSLAPAVEQWTCTIHASHHHTFLLGRRISPFLNVR